MLSMSSSGSRTPRWHAWLKLLIAGLIESVCLSVALVTAWSLFQVTSLLRRNPFGWAELGDLLAAVWCALASWGFYRFLAYLCGGEGLAARHPGELAWWLTGGLWVAACAGGLAVEGPSDRSYVISATIRLGTLLAAPIVVALLVTCLRQHERTRGRWWAWLGFAVGWTIPLPWFLLSVLSRL